MIWKHYRMTLITAGKESGVLEEVKLDWLLKEVNSLAREGRHIIGLGVQG